MELLKQTNSIEGKVGVAFGFRFKTKAPSNFSGTFAKFCGSHPPMRNPKTGFQQRNQCFNHLLKADKLQWHTFVIENEWEIVPGDWKLYIQHEGMILAEKSFIIK